MSPSRCVLVRFLSSERCTTPSEAATSTAAEGRSDDGGNRNVFFTRTDKGGCSASNPRQRRGDDSAARNDMIITLLLLLDANCGSMETENEDASSSMRKRYCDVTAAWKGFASVAGSDSSYGR